MVVGMPGSGSLLNLPTVCTGFCGSGAITDAIFAFSAFLPLPIVISSPGFRPLTLRTYITLSPLDASTESPDVESPIR